MAAATPVPPLIPVRMCHIWSRYFPHLALACSLQAEGNTTPQDEYNLNSKKIAFFRVFCVHHPWFCGIFWNCFDSNEEPSRRRSIWRVRLPNWAKTATYWVVIVQTQFLSNFLTENCAWTSPFVVVFIKFNPKSLKPSPYVRLSHRKIRHFSIV